MSQQLSLVEVDRLLKEADEDKRALERVRRILLKSSASSVSVIPSDPSFRDLVRKAARSFGRNTDITVREVESVLRKEGAKLPKSKVRERIAMTLKLMCDDGEMIKAKGGRGNTPHIYRLV